MSLLPMHKRLPTEAVATARQAAQRYAAGDRDGAAALLAVARSQYLQGQAELLDFFAPIATDVRNFRLSLAGVPSGLIDQVGKGLPRFDLGGVMPGPPGQHGVALVGGGEHIYTGAQHGEMVGLIRRVEDAFDRGYQVSVLVEDRTEHVVKTAETELARAQAQARRLQRTAGVLVPNTCWG